MSSSVGVLDFFILEAGDYVERLDGLVAASGPAGPDADAFSRYARMLRGSATMARLSALAELATGVERVGRGLQQGATQWSPALSGVLVSAIDDLKILIRGVRTWGAPEEQRARIRILELAAINPEVMRRAPTPVSANAGPTGVTYLSSAASEIAAALEAYAARPVAREVLSSALERIRALRGVAALKDVPPLPDVLDALERAAKPLELGPTEPSDAQLTLFRASAALLRRASSEIRGGGRPEMHAPEVQQFAAAAAALAEAGDDADRIVPIARLFFGDGGEHVTHRSAHPPTTPPERFRLEVVSQAEHLRRLVADAREARDGVTRERLSRELRGALRALANAAEGFGEHQIAQHVTASRDAIASLDSASLAALESVAALLANPATGQGELLASLDALANRRASAAAAGPGTPSEALRSEARTAPGASAAPPRSEPTPVAPSALALASAADTRIPARGHPTPTGKELHAMLQDGIAGITRLDDRPLSEPVPIVDDTVVPIDALVYRGRAALHRAIEVRDEVRGSGADPSGPALAELYDLLDLAAAE